MSVIEQLKDGKIKAFAEYCYERFSADELRDAAEGPADPAEMRHWSITEGEWEEAVTAALADIEGEKKPPHQ